MIFAKYAFPDGVWEQLKPTIQSEEQYIDCAVVELGNICEQTDEEGNCVQQSPLYSVDIMWYNEIPESFSTYEVFPAPCGIHVFSGCEEIYKNRFCQFNPDSPYCQIAE